MILQDMEGYLKSKLGESYEVLVLEYIKLKVEHEPGFYEKLNTEMFKGIVSNIDAQRTRTSNVEVVAVAALSMLDDTIMSKKKNFYWLEVVDRQIDNILGVRVDDLKELVRKVLKAAKAKKREDDEKEVIE